MLVKLGSFLQNTVNKGSFLWAKPYIGDFSRAVQVDHKLKTPLPASKNLDGRRKQLLRLHLILATGETLLLLLIQEGIKPDRYRRCLA